MDKKKFFQQLYMNTLFKKVSGLLDKMAEHPEFVDENDEKNLNRMYSQICKTLGISEHSQWRVEWRVEKWLDTAKKIAGFAPDEVCIDTQNIILDVGANEIMKVLAGTGGTPYDASNAYIYVGTDSSRESADQTGLIATGVNRAYAAMDIGYPVVTGRQGVWRASFGDTSANFNWQEFSLVNGTGANAVAMNRKVQNLGTKATGTWSLQLTVSIVSA